MKPKYKLGRCLINLILFACLFLQNCGGKKLTSTDAENIQPVDFPGFPPEIWEIILSYLDMEELLKSTILNKYFFEAITGFSLDNSIYTEMFGYKGIEHADELFEIDSSDGKNALTLKRALDFSKEKIKELTPQTIPTLLFCRLTGTVRNLPKRFWPYLKKTRIHTVDLSSNQYIRIQEVAELANNLQGTRVSMVDLNFCLLGDNKAIAFAKNLQGTNVETIDLSFNEIGDKGAIEFVKNLQGTNVKTIYLGNNEIGKEGGAEFANSLKGTNVDTIYLEFNEIGDEWAIDFVNNLENINIKTIDLSLNSNISKNTKKALQETYPNITWGFAKKKVNDI